MAKQYQTKKKIHVLIRLYRLHDLDLLTLIMTREFDFVKCTYCALSAFAKGDAFVVDIPPKRNTALPEFKKVYARQLNLDVERDKELIEVLNHIKKGYRNCFLKNLLRLYLCYPLSELFMEDEASEDYFQNACKIFRKNRRLAKAADLKPRTFDKFLNGSGSGVDSADEKHEYETDVKKSETKISESASKKRNEKEKAELNSTFWEEKEVKDANSQEMEQADGFSNSGDDEDITDLFASLIG